MPDCEGSVSSESHNTGTICRQEHNVPTNDSEGVGQKVVDAKATRRLTDKQTAWHDLSEFKVHTTF